MVFFVCGACGETFKRKQADQHRFRCRNWNFSCIDCNKDFAGDSYVQHKQCITESEKYFGSHHVSKKGKDKNEIWIEKVKKHINSQTKMKPYYARLLARIVKYPNIPRKQSKFENFLKVNLNMTHKESIEELWKIVSAANDVTDASDKENTADNNGENESSDAATPTDQDGKSDNNTKTEKEAVKEKSADDDEHEAGSEVKPKKSKKRKPTDDDDEMEEPAADSEEEQKESKSARRKRRKQRESATEEPDPLAPARLAMGDLNQRDFGDYEDIEVETVTAKNNFKWRSTLKKLLKEAPSEGIKIKKLLNKIEQLHNDELEGSAQPLPKDILQTILMKTLSKKPFSIANNRAKIGKFPKEAK